MAGGGGRFPAASEIKQENPATAAGETGRSVTRNWRGQRSLRMGSSPGERSSGPSDAPRPTRWRGRSLLIIGALGLAALLLAANYDALRSWELSRQSETALLAQAEAQPADTQLQRVAAERLIEADRPRDALRLL